MQTRITNQPLTNVYIIYIYKTKQNDKNKLFTLFTNSAKLLGTDSLGKQVEGRLSS